MTLAALSPERSPRFMPVTLYDVTELRACDVDKSFPVAQMLHPELTAEQWRRGAAQALDPSSDVGMLVARRDNYIYGLALYRIVDRLTDGRVLAIEELAAVDIVNADWIYHRFLTSLEREARRRGCERMECQFADADPGVEPGRSLARYGLVEDGRRYGKLLPSAAVVAFDADAVVN